MNHSKEHKQKQNQTHFQYNLLIIHINNQSNQTPKQYKYYFPIVKFIFKGSE